MILYGCTGIQKSKVPRVKIKKGKLKENGLERINIIKSISNNKTIILNTM